MLRSPCQGLLEELDGLVIASLRQQQFPWPQPLTARHRLLHIVQGLDALLDFSRHHLQALGGILELCVQRPSMRLRLGYCLFQVLQTYQEDTQAPERRQKCQRREGYTRDELYQRCIAHAADQCPHHPQYEQHICQPLHASPHTYRPSASLDLS